MMAMFGKQAYYYPVYYNGKFFDHHNRSVWIWQGDGDVFKREKHRPLSSRAIMPQGRHHA